MIAFNIYAPYLNIVNNYVNNVNIDYIESKM